MTKETAWYNVKQGKSIPYKKETLATIRALIEQESKTGHWILKPNVIFNSYPDLCCDQCGRSAQTRTNYCPYCGAKMEVNDDNKINSRG